MSFFNIDPALRQLCAKAEEKAAASFRRIDSIAQYNSEKVLSAFINNHVSESHFAASTGYGYGDRGREVLDQVLAEILGCEDALIRYNFMSGTHALTVALFGVLRPGDRMVSLTGLPYDTLHGVIGLGQKEEVSGSLKDFGVQYEQLDLLEDGKVNYEGIPQAVKGAKVAYIQRSRGYSLRPSLFVEDIERIVGLVRSVNPEAIIMVDNCYGEFVQEKEPTQVGADLIIGSLIKNPGGGLAPIGGYIVGKKECVERAAFRLTAPGLGKELGASLGVNQAFYQGLFLAPQVVSGALKGAIFAANIYEKLGFEVVPNSTESRHDIIQAVVLGSPEGVIKFCKGIQAAAPVDSFADPEPWAMPGYDSDVIMAAGAFVQGSSIELSADGPIKPPYAVYFQGGITWYHSKFGIMMSLEKLVESGIIRKAALITE